MGDLAKLKSFAKGVLVSACFKERPDAAELSRGFGGVLQMLRNDTSLLEIQTS